MTQMPSEALRRQSPVQILFILGYTLRKTWYLFLVPVYRMLNRGEHDTVEKSGYNLVWMILLFILLFFISSLVSYLFFRFSVSPQAITIRKGIGVKKNLVIPKSSIQGLLVHQSLFHRITHTYSLTLDSAGSDKAEATFQAIDRQTLSEIEDWLSDANVEIKQDTSIKYPGKETGRTIYQLSKTDFLRLWLSENHLKTLSVIGGFGLSRIMDLQDLLGISPTQLWEKHGKAIGITITIIGLVLVAGSILTLMVSGVLAVARYFNYRIAMLPAMFLLEWGLLETRKSQVPFSKIQVVSWRANWLRRKLGLWMVRLHTLNDPSEKQYSKTEFPFVGEQKIIQLTQSIVEAWPCNPDHGHQVSPKMVFRYWLLKGALVSLIFMGLSWYWIGWWALAGVLYPIYYWWAMGRLYSNLRWCIDGQNILVQKGIWGRKCWIANMEKTQQVWLSTSPWQRRNALADLHLGFGSATITIPMLERQIADDVLHRATAISSFGRAIAIG